MRFLCNETFRWLSTWTYKRKCHEEFSLFLCLLLFLLQRFLKREKKNGIFWSNLFLSTCGTTAPQHWNGWMRKQQRKFKFHFFLIVVVAWEKDFSWKRRNSERKSCRANKKWKFSTFLCKFFLKRNRKLCENYEEKKNNWTPNKKVLWSRFKFKVRRIIFMI